MLLRTKITFFAWNPKLWIYSNANVCLKNLHYTFKNLTILHSVIWLQECQQSDILRNLLQPPHYSWAEYSCLRFKYSGFGSFLAFLLFVDHITMLHYPLLESSFSVWFKPSPPNFPRQSHGGNGTIGQEWSYHWLLESPPLVLHSNYPILLLLSPSVAFGTVTEVTAHFDENVDDRDAGKSDQSMENEDLQPWAMSFSKAEEEGNTLSPPTAPPCLSSRDQTRKD